MKKNKTMKERLRSYILRPEDRDYAFRNLDEKKLQEAIDNYPRFLRRNALFPPSTKKPSSFIFNDLALRVAGEPGFEPRLTESESAVLPLNYSPTDVMCLYRPLYPSLQHLFLFYSVNNRRYTVYHKLRSHRPQNYSQYLRYNLVNRLTH